MRNCLDVAVIGAGPYGLSLASHLGARGLDFRIFGEPMGAWKNNMPPGMLLKSYPWASNLSDHGSCFTVRQFCAERAIPYHNSMMPLPLDTFISYGEAFQARHVPQVERKSLVSVEPITTGLRAAFDDGEILDVRHMVLGVGLSAFKYLPAIAASLPPEMVSHSSDYGPFDRLEGQNVVVVGSGSSATDLAALLHERGISVSLVTRRNSVDFASLPRPRRLFERIVAPTSGIGNGWTMSLCAEAPWIVHHFPEKPRVRLANAKALGPLGGAFMKDKVIGRVPFLLGRTFEKAELRNGTLLLHLTSRNGTQDILRADHVIFATGYKVDVSRLPFLNSDLVARMRLIEKAPLLSSHYESSIPGLHFIGPASASSFGPVCRFVFGTRHPARHLARYLPSVLGHRAMCHVNGLAPDLRVQP